MASRLEAWLQRLGEHILQHGWCDPFGVSIPPDLGHRLDESNQGWTGSIEPGAARDVVPVE